MGTEVLRPHDVLAERFHSPPPTFYRRRNNFPAPAAENSRYHHHNNRKTSPRPEKKNQFEPKRQQQRRRDDVSPPANRKAITLLRRGESLDSITNQKAKATRSSPNRQQKQHVDDMGVTGTGRIGPESPEMVPRRIRVAGPVDTYAGSAFSMSPSPRSVPLPSFFNNKQVDDPASRDLRRLLRLE